MSASTLNGSKRLIDGIGQGVGLPLIADPIYDLSSRRQASEVRVTPAVEFDPVLVPEELRERPQWVGWKYEVRDGNATKVPMNVGTGRMASSTDPNTWCGFDEAVRGLPRHPDWAGIGFVFSPDDPIAGVDLDECIDDEGNIVPSAREIIEALDSYTEVSPSGRGVKIHIRANKGDEKRSKSKAIPGFKESEVYDRGRYFTVTGRHLPGTPLTVEPRQAELDALRERLWPSSNAPLTHSVLGTAPFDGNSGSDDEDDALFRRASRAKNGAKFVRLMGGDTSDHAGDDSAADLALCAHLAFWTGRDPGRIDRMFRGSGLMRAKWNEKRGQQTYGQMTIAKALESAGPGRERSVPASDRAGGDRSDGLLRCTDVGNGARLAREFGDRLRYVHEWKAWIWWDGKRWIEDVGHAQECAKRVARLLYADAANADDDKAAARLAAWAKSTASAKHVEAMLKMARSEPGITVLSEDLDADPWLLNTPTGVVDLRTGLLRPHDSALLMTKIAGAGFQPSAASPRWSAFLERTFGGDSELIAFMQRAAGYSLSGATTEQVLFINHGTGCNGKTTLIETLAECAGSYAQATPASTLLASTHADRGPRDDVAALKGARVVTASESADGRGLNESLVKSLTGGDRVAARHLYGRFFTFSPTFKVWLSTNHKPQIMGTDEGIWRRVRLIPFNVRIPEGERDPRLRDKLCEESEGILRWMVQGCLDWQHAGLGMPKAVSAATSDYRLEQDSVAEFLAERCEAAPEFSVGASEIFSVYRSWCDGAGIQPLNNTRFGSSLSDRNFAVDRHPASRRKVRLGVRLRGGEDTPC